MAQVEGTVEVVSDTAGGSQHGECPELLEVCTDRMPPQDADLEARAWAGVGQTYSTQRDMHTPAT